MENGETVAVAQYDPSSLGDKENAADMGTEEEEESPT